MKTELQGFILECGEGTSLPHPTISDFRAVSEGHYLFMTNVQQYREGKAYFALFIALSVRFFPFSEMSLFIQQL
jgi:hypothetical protein